MGDLSFLFMLLFAGTSLLLAGVSVPLARGRVRPNPVYGVRTAKTLGDESAWYRGNAYGGRLLLRTGLAQLALVVGLYGVPALRANFAAYSGVCGACIVGSLLVTSALTLRYVRSL